MVDLYGERFSVSVSDMAEKQAATIWEVKNGQVPEGLSPETSPGGGGSGLGTEGSPSAVDGPGGGGRSREGGFPGNRPVGQAPT